VCAKFPKEKLKNFKNELPILLSLLYILNTGIMIEEANDRNILYLKN
jgi:hypothetical protein